MSIRRKIKSILPQALAAADIEETLSLLQEFSEKQLIGAILQRIVSLESEEKWRAVSLTGELISSLADTDFEDADRFIERIYWVIAKEKNAFPLGYPELLAEGLARNRSLAESYVGRYIEFVEPGCGFMDNNLMLQGALWGVGRMAMVFPDLLQKAAPFLAMQLEKNDTLLKAYAIWSLSFLDLQDMNISEKLNSLARDNSEIELFSNGKLDSTTISDLLKLLKT